MPKLVNLGSLCVDHVYEVDHLVAAGETVASRSHSVFPGGKGLNQSLAAAKAGAAVVHVGVVGGDGAMLVDVLSDAGVDTSGIRTVDAASGHAVIQVNEQGANAIVITGGANRLIQDTDIDQALRGMTAGDYLLLQNEINDLTRVMERAEAAGVRVAFNVAPVDGRERAYDIGLISLLIVNEIEAAALSGEQDPELGFDTLASRFPEVDIVLTLGASGLLYGKRGEKHRMPAFDVDPVDETAAGDAFIGYFMAGLLAGVALPQALRMGSAAGALAVTQAGAASSVPDREAVRDFLERH